MPVSIIDIDMGWDAYRAAGQSIASADGDIEGNKGVLVEAGLFDDGESPSVAEIGAWQELGTREIPPRPWMSLAADQGEAQIVDAAKDAALQAFDGQPLQAAYQAMGNKVVKLEAEVILADRVGGPALAARTVQAKGFDKKLVDTGNMVDSLEAEVTA